MRRLTYILLSIVAVLWIGSCSPAEIRQAQVLSQAEIDEHNKNYPVDEPDTPPGPQDPDDPQHPEDPDSPVTPGLKDYYVSVIGAGEKNGSSAADAMDLATFKEFARKRSLLDSSQEDIDKQVEALDGVTFHFADGNYPLWDAEHPEGLSLGFDGTNKTVRLTLEGSAGTVFTGSNQYRILRASGKMRLTLKEITLSDGLTPDHGAALFATGCSLTLQDCTIKGNRSEGSSDKNGNNGGAIYLAKDVTSAVFTDCSFANNRIETTSTDQYGGAVRIEGASQANDVTFENCSFTGNFAKQASCISVNAKTRLKINNCIFSGNTANSRGMIQMAGGTVFINGSTFYSNRTSDNNGWGVVLHGKGYVCMNNCTIYGNSNASTMEGNNNVSINGYHSLLMVNCTLIESCQLGLLRIDDAAGKQVLCNNILVNTAGKPVLVGNASAVTLSNGHNAMSNFTFSSFTAHETDILNCTEESFGSHAYASNVYTWNGVLPGFTAASQDDVTRTMTDSFDVELADVMSGIGAAFFEWLDGMSPKGYSVDGRGEVRGAAFWPGAYQGEAQELPGDSLIDMDPVIIH